MSKYQFAICDVMKPSRNPLTCMRATMTLSSAFFSLALVVPQSTLAQPPAASTPSGTALLQQLERAERGVEYAATEVVSRPGAPDVVARVWRSGFRRRLEWQSPPVMSGDILVDTGAQVWRYLRSENTAIGTRSTVGEADWERISGRFDAKVVGVGEQDGRAAWQLALEPRGENRIVRKLWIDRVKGILLRLEQFDARGQLVKTIALRDVRFGAVPADRFRWSPPAGAQITRMDGTLWTSLAPAQRAASWLRAPSQSTLPRGYILESAIVDAKGAKGQGEVWLRYTNGLNRFSVFEQRAPEAPERALQRVGSAWFWTRGGIRFVVAGLDEANVKELANSLK